MPVVHQTPLPLRPRLLDQVRDTIRRKHYSQRTGQAYLHWIKRYIHFHDKRHPAELGGSHVTTFLNHLATVGQVSASTQNQALAALLFLYREVLEINLPWLEGLTRAKRPQRLPTVLTQAEVKSVLAALEGTRWLMVMLLYGAGMRLNECLNLRVKDVDFEGRLLLGCVGLLEVHFCQTTTSPIPVLHATLQSPSDFYPSTTSPHTTSTLTSAISTAALPMSLARLAS